MELFKKLSEASPVSTLLAVASLALIIIGACLGLLQEVVAPLSPEQLENGYVTYGAVLVYLGIFTGGLSLLGFILNSLFSIFKYVFKD